MRRKKIQKVTVKGRRGDYKMTKEDRERLAKEIAIMYFNSIPKRLLEDILEN